jgi:hypothetical protein
MDIERVLAQLREERQAIDAAIVSLERLEHGRHRGPGRPPDLVVKNSPNGANHGSHPPDLTPRES